MSSPATQSTPTTGEDLKAKLHRGEKTEPAEFSRHYQTILEPLAKSHYTHQFKFGGRYHVAIKEWADYLGTCRSLFDPVTMADCDELCCFLFLNSMQGKLATNAKLQRDERFRRVSDAFCREVPIGFGCPSGRYTRLNYLENVPLRYGTWHICQMPSNLGGFGRVDEGGKSPAFPSHPEYLREIQNMQEIYLEQLARGPDSDTTANGGLEVDEEDLVVHLRTRAA
ncbi:hypothetical protein MAPG_08816 [Magnaporthiopsis poae ATCC 64411]|uniref:Uncharacterized protein n=1 Tax=Magnaporthiopsis poae (strain ATCC 64411 / 73-15) TaxID=644358 RepID=A0A0C4E8B6_MAGP6|nr:hypothetical protein MAPG_08816 [Magnaporthiopsis poae ATCC 64411]